MLSRNTTISLTVLILPPLVYLSILWTVASVGGNEGVWKLLDLTLEIAHDLCQILEKFLVKLDVRVSEEFAPALYHGMQELSIIISKGATYFSVMLTEASMVLLYLVCKIVDRLYMFSDLALYTLADLVRFLLVTIFRLFEPDGSHKLTLTIWVLLTARLMDRVIDNREDVEFLLGFVGKVIQEIVLTTISGMEKISAFAIRLAIAYGIVRMARYLEHPLSILFQGSDGSKSKNDSK